MTAVEDGVGEDNRTPHTDLQPAFPANIAAGRKTPICLNDARLITDTRLNAILSPIMMRRA
jgi:hypothetical protein